MNEQSINRRSEEGAAGPHIALAPGSINEGGIGSTTLNLAGALAEAGARVDLVLTARPDGTRPIPPGVRLIQLSDRARGAFGPACRYLRAARPDMVITARNYMHLLMLVAHRVARLGGRCRLVWTFHTHRSTELAHAARKDRWLDALAIRTIRRADGLVAVSRGVAQDLARGAGLPDSDVRVIANPAWKDRYLELAAEPCPHPWLGTDEGPVILGIGRLVPQKDFPTLLRAVAGLGATSPVRVILLGEGPERARLEGLAEALGLAGRVSLPGHVPNIFAYLSRADLFVLSSKWEGFGMVLIEALGCRCPVVSTDCPSGPAEILRPEALVPVGDVPALSRAIETTLGAPRGADTHDDRIAGYRPEIIARHYLSFLGAR